MPAADAEVRAIAWTGDTLVLLDQRVLPARVAYLTITDLESAARAITDMVVRGAPAIGITAAYGAVLGGRAEVQAADAGEDRDGRPAWAVRLEDRLATLDAARPTAVNLRWATDRVRELLRSDAPSVDALERLAVAIHEEDIAANQRMGELGAEALDGVSGVITHCNAGALATGGYGTALGVIRSLWRRGGLQSVFADETRPWLQGARLTAYELAAEGIPVQLVAEGAAPWLMRQGHAGAVIVGADRVAANGDCANKIGTYALALAARHHGLRFMVVAPTSTLDLSIPTGDDIPIEERAGEELLELGGRRLAPPGVGAWNPVFDVTPAELVDVLVTERGVVERPDTAAIRALMDGA